MTTLSETIHDLPWLPIIGWAITTVTFYLKLTFDSKHAQYRETINYIEKREESMRKRWHKVSDIEIDCADKSEDVYAFFSQLELISLLLSKRAFDEDIVYNFWWRYFDEPLKSREINTWLVLEQQSDKQVFINYLNICKKWANRIDKEQGRQTAE